MEYFGIGFFVVGAIFLLAAALIVRWGESASIIELKEHAKQANQKATDALKLAQANAETVGSFHVRLTAYGESMSNIMKDCEQIDQQNGEVMAICQKLKEELNDLKVETAKKDQNITITLVEPSETKTVKSAGGGVKALIQETSKKAKGLKK